MDLCSAVEAPVVRSVFEKQVAFSKETSSFLLVET